MMSSEENYPGTDGRAADDGKKSDMFFNGMEPMKSGNITMLFTSGSRTQLCLDNFYW